MVGGFPRKEGLERKDEMSKSVAMYKAQASASKQHAAPNCKVLVVANLANTNALILKEFDPSILEKNITCLTRLDHNSALGQISERVNVHVGDVKNVYHLGQSLFHSIPSCQSRDGLYQSWREACQRTSLEFIAAVQQRGAAITKARKFSSALSAASSACDHIRDWVLGTPQMGLMGSNPAFYSFPVTCQKGEWSIVQGLKIDEFSRKKMDATANDPIEEKSLAYSCLKG
ncbi:Lactate/malate dehydrogenase, C-terminal [Dillenia turbinata]|uniref:Lactate/malate dehydrogenase, C-terminal n=1 Tax=Dillenia turbinata TaxID=194707 RepID=A0AAN8UN61_9MAGN